MTKISLEGRVAIVTGAGRGIGREYALHLAARGAKVVVNDLGAALNGTGSDPSLSERVVEEIRAMGGDAVANGDNVATVTGGRRIVDTALEAFGAVDILIQNAGILRDRSFLKMSEAEWDDVVSVNLKGAFCVAQPALKAMKDKGYGRVVFTSSTSGLFGAFGQANYGAAKMGVVGLMNSLKIEMAKYDIAINTVAPTGDTRMTENLFTEDVRSRLRSELNVPLVVYLSSEECRVTGMTFCMKGGWYGRAAVVCGQGVSLDPFDGLITAELLRDRFQEIADLDHARPLEKGSDTLDFMKK